MDDYVWVGIKEMNKGKHKREVMYRSRLKVVHNMRHMIS